MVSPGLEDVESLTPGESAPTLLGWLDVRVIIQAFLQCEQRLWVLLQHQDSCILQASTIDTSCDDKQCYGM